MCTAYMQPMTGLVCQVSLNQCLTCKSTGNIRHVAYVSRLNPFDTSTTFNPPPPPLSNPTGTPDWTWRWLPINDVPVSFQH